MSKNYYISGQWNVICDVCGKKIKSGKAKQRWDGFIVCEDDFESRHPQDFVKARVDKITVPFVRPIQTSVYTISCTINGSSSIIDYATVGCSVVDFIPNAFSPDLPCIPLSITAPTIYDAFDTIWCCGSLDVQDSVTIQNILGII